MPKPYFDETLFCPYWLQCTKEIIYAMPVIFETGRPDSGVCLFKNDVRIRIWCRIGESFEVSHVDPSGAFGGGFVMEWNVNEPWNRSIMILPPP